MEQPYMAQFIAFDPQTEVSGASMRAVVDALGDQGRHILQDNGLDPDPQPGKWYPQQPYLNMYRAIAEQKYNSVPDLVSIGMHVPSVAPFPPEIDSIETALTALNEAYQMNHRNGEIGSYESTLVAPCHIKVVCRNPYPSDFDYGLIYGVVRRFRPAGVTFKVVVDDQAPSRKKGADSCTYHIYWD